MLKKKTLISMLILLTFSFLCFSPVFVQKGTVYAQANSDIIYNDLDGIIDENLYNNLLWNNYNKFLPSDQREIYITKNMFANLTHLDLAGFEISSLYGIHLLNMPNLKSIDVSNNNLSAFNEYTLEFLKNIEVLNLSHNDFNNIELETFLNLSKLDVSFNKLKEIDISNLVEKDNLIQVNLMGNLFEDCQSIIVDNNKKYHINLMFNLLTNVENDFFTNNDVDVYVQNKFPAKIETSEKFKVFSGVTYSDFKVKVTLNGEHEWWQTNSENSLDVGFYKFSFYNGEQNLYDELNSATDAFKPKDCKLVPQCANYEIIADKTVIENFKQSSVINAKKIKLNFSSPDNATIQISVNDEDFKSVSEIEFTKRGNYIVYVKCEKDGIESRTLAVHFYMQEKQALSPITTVMLCVTGLILVCMAWIIYAKKPVNFNKKKKEND